MGLVQLGEFGLINRIRQILGDGSDDVVLGVGDDAAVFRTHPGWMTILTTDALVEGVHFDLRYTPLNSLGWKALAINLSDVVAMGGIPGYGVVSLALPKDWKMEDVDLFYEGMVRCGKEYGCLLVGGDTARSKRGCFLAVAVVGEVEEECVVSRKGAHEGDILCVTGELGGARVGLEVLASGKDRNRYPKSVDRFLEPKVRLREARQLVTEIGVSSMIDISDGLSSEIGHICRESGLGCLVWEDRIPVLDEAVHWAEEQKRPLAKYAFESGEEYELLFTVDRTRYDKRRARRSDESDLPVTVVGEMTRKEEGIRIKRGEEIFPLVPTGWDHFEE